MPLLRALPVEWRNLGVNFLNTACLTFLRISAHLHFCWTEVGAELAGVAQSLIVTCRLHDIDPYDYLVDVLQRVGQHPASEVAQLTPRLWKQHFSANPLRSNLLLGSYNIAGIFQYYPPAQPNPSLCDPTNCSIFSRFSTADNVNLNSKSTCCQRPLARERLYLIEIKYI